MRIALYQPDIPQNTGTILRLAACFALPVDIIEPAGFPFSERTLRRAGMDYLDKVQIMKHVSFEAFLQWREETKQGPLLLFTTKGDRPYHRFDFSVDDHLLFGRESAGVPEDVHQTVDARITIPIVPDCRSLNLAVSASIAVGEAMRQTGGLDALT